MDFEFKVVGVVLTLLVVFIFADIALRQSEMEDCWRLERQVEQGYIKTLPEWCEEVLPGH